MSSNPLVWTDDRCKQLESFRALLREASLINSGSGCLPRIAKCIDLAEQLLWAPCGDNERTSFYYFLHDLAIENRTEMKGE